jgi:hypothetical protein
VKVALQDPTQKLFVENLVTFLKNSKNKKIKKTLTK